MNNFGGGDIEAGEVRGGGNSRGQQNELSPYRGYSPHRQNLTISELNERKLSSSTGKLTPSKINGSPQSWNESSISSISNSLTNNNSPNCSPTSSGFSNNTNISHLNNINNTISINNNNNNIRGAADKNTDYGDSQYLPICDALFNVISLSAYFINVTFDLLSVYSLVNEGKIEWAIAALIFISFSIILSQILSFKWYRAEWEANGSNTNSCKPQALALLHFSLCGVLWRYFKLFIPVDIRFIKQEVRYLCILRLVHGFCEATPMVIIQLFLIWSKGSKEEVTDLDIVSSALSLFNICWALASYSKNIRSQNVDKLVLTWVGILCQFVWRAGTVTSRIIALSVYASAYSYYIIIVVVLHWFSMMMWLISPKNIFHGEKMSITKKLGYSSLVAVVYIICYIHIEESNSRRKAIVYYITILLEDSLLVGVFLLAKRYEEVWYQREIIIILTFASFFVGILFMCLYYKFFHVKKLSWTYGETGTNSSSPSLINGDCSNSTLNKKMGNGNMNTYVIEGNQSEGRVKNGEIGHYGKISKSPILQKRIEPRRGLYNKTNGHHIHHVQNVQNGVFNCRFNPAIKRKKKKPTSFVPPPSNGRGNNNNNNNNNNNKDIPNENEIKDSIIKLEKKRQDLTNHLGKMSNPFWKRPLSITMGSENESSIGSRVDIQQKLQEKKLKQLQDLREIQEEINQGKLEGRVPERERNIREPIPFSKKQPIFADSKPKILIPPPNANEELILDPNYLIYSHAADDYYEIDWNYYEPLYENDLELDEEGKKNPNSNGIYKSYHIPSDCSQMSQMSLSRSCLSQTLPREFKYKRKFRKIIKTDHFVPSTNSSDGDVDSGEDEHEQDDPLDSFPVPVPIPSGQFVNTANGRKYFGSRRKRVHETKL